MTKKDLISIIIPCFNEEEAIPIYYDEMNKFIKDMNNVDFELMFIDDGSTDKTLSVLKSLNKKDDKVHYISFSRNFGKEAGMLAGLEHVKGDYVAIMDVDLQDPPSMIKEMYKNIKEEDYDCIALYTNSHEGYGFIRKRLTNMWYKLITKIAKSKQKPGARDLDL